MYRQLLNLDVYGDTEIKKEEFVNHVHKRMGSALSRLLPTRRKEGVKFQGNGVGRLTGPTIKKLGLYLSKAVRKI